ncbi:MAG: hypothetical protein DRJ51_02455 [Thermoprotei archaeon]|nr:MAG: hypothetical protein DRJ51_02455 [Thermoprotei archaeon]
MLTHTAILGGLKEHLGVKTITACLVALNFENHMYCPTKLTIGNEEEFGCGMSEERLVADPF